MKFEQYLARKKGCSQDTSDSYKSRIAHLGKIPTTTDGPPYTIKPIGSKTILSYINEEGQTVYTKQINVSPSTKRK